MSGYFVADVGGTNIRVATVTADGIANIRKYLCNDFATIDLALKQYFSDVDTSFSAGCIAIACPVTGDEVAMTNHSWVFSQRALTQQLNLDALFVINDFTAVAHSLPVLSGEQLVQIGSGTANPQGNVVVFGPGTGLGVEHMQLSDQGWTTLDGEGGHVDFAPVDETDLVVWRYLQGKLDRVSAEDVLSGRGLLHIYQALALHTGETLSVTEPAQVTEKALNGECETCLAALQQFCRIMGSFAGNLALNLATTGGVFIGGGIATRFTELLMNSDFRARFEAKGRMKHYVQPIPTYLINEPDHGLLGASAYLQQQIAS
ncbi:MAG: glucokinase [Pseudomonadota bacterium]|nr:glucokinase [Pseudomonadota bacterium]MEC7824409.1 glucokinase [Pseudomonadota bacterium]